MFERKLYTCEYCHTDYIYKVNAEKCEANHLKNLTVIDKTYLSGNTYKPNFPIKITVKAEDGRMQDYKRIE